MRQQEEGKKRVTFTLLSLFPDYFRGPCSVSLLKQAQEKGLLAIETSDIRDYTEDKHRRVDDRPFGGGPGMVMTAQPICAAIRDKRRPGSHVIYLSPQGKPLTAEKCRELAEKEHLILLCGHYEGVDERVLESEVDEEVSIGDYVLTSGCAAAVVLVDAVSRFLPGVIGHPDAAAQDSFEQGHLDCPHYTRPEVFEERPVPPVLLSGNHQAIAAWRREKGLEKTRQVRPDLNGVST